MNKKGSFYVVFFTIILFVVVITVLFFFKKQVTEEFSAQTFYDEKQSCTSDITCSDGEACTIDSCIDGFCKHTEVLMCYMDDGCCPENCNQGNDNDCLG